MAKTLIAAQTAAAQSDTINVNVVKMGTLTGIHGTDLPVGTTLQITGGTLGAGEYVKLRYHDGTDWRDANMDGNDGKVLDENNAVYTVYGRMESVRLEKSITASALGVEAT